MNSEVYIKQCVCDDCGDEYLVTNETPHQAEDVCESCYITYKLWQADCIAASANRMMKNANKRYREAYANVDYPYFY